MLASKTGLLMRNNRHHSLLSFWDRPFVRSCLFQSTERDRLREFLRGAAPDAGCMRLLQQAAPVELALEAAHLLEWDR